MRFLKTKKGVALLVTLVVVAAAAFGAYAFFTAAGTGSGTASAGPNDVTITLTAAGFSNIVPGDGGKDVTFTAANGSLTTTGHVATVSKVSVTDTDTSAAGVACEAYLSANQADFTMPTVTGENTPIPAGGTAVTLPIKGHLTWGNNDNIDQTPCAAQSLTLNVSST